MTFSTFLLSVVVFFANGAVDPPISRVFTTQADCDAAGAKFEAEIREINAEGSPAMQMTWHWECRLVSNDTGKRAA
jgi:hypothetical protein